MKKKVFKITGDENINFDTEHSDHINRYITVNGNRLHSFSIANIMERLPDENYITRKTTLEEIKMYIRTKNIAPGSIKINRQIQEKCANKTQGKLKNIFNARPSAGYFPNVFIDAIIKFIPRKDRAITSPINSIIQFPYLKYSVKYFRE